MNDKLKAGDRIHVDGKVYRVYDDGQRLRLWLISQPKKKSISGIAKILTELKAQHAAADAEWDAKQLDYDQTMAAAAGRWGH